MSDTIQTKRAVKADILGTKGAQRKALACELSVLAVSTRAVTRVERLIKETVKVGKRVEGLVEELGERHCGRRV